MTGKSIAYQSARKALISCAETWPGKSLHGSVGLSLQSVKAAADASQKP